MHSVLHTHTHTFTLCHNVFSLALLAHILYIYNVKIVIALSTQLVRFLRGASLSEVVFASKSSLSLRFIETYPNVLGAHPLLVVFNFYTNTHPLYVIVHTRTFLHTHTHTHYTLHISSFIHHHVCYVDITHYRRTSNRSSIFCREFIALCDAVCAFVHCARMNEWCVTLFYSVSYTVSFIHSLRYYVR